MSTKRPTLAENPSPRVAVLGATGLVGQEMLRLLEERRFPLGELLPLASARSANRTVRYAGADVPVQEATPERLASCDLVLSSAGGAVSRELLPGAARAGAICIDNTSAFRMDPDVALVVPEVNGHRLDAIRESGAGAIIANPNCSTIQLVVAMKPLHDAAGIRGAVVSTYQSISGAGRRAVDAFRGATSALLNGTDELPEPLRGTPAFDTLPTIGDLTDEGDTLEERKMVQETPKILEADVPVDVTCVRVPVFVGHAESVLLDLERPLTVAEAERVLAAAPGIVVTPADAPPTQRGVAGDGKVHVGRLRAARTTRNGLQMWVVADNLLKGAALNAVQIAEVLRAPELARA